jgi:hypothetical protein
LANRAFPTSLAAALSAAPWQPPVDLGKDPYVDQQDFGFQRSATSPVTVTVRSRGADGALNTGDDLVTTLDDQTVGRRPTRNRLRVIRSLWLRFLVASTPTM